MMETMCLGVSNDGDNVFGGISWKDTKAIQQHTFHHHPQGIFQNAKG